LENILEPVSIQTNPAVPILEASIQKTSRHVTGIKLDASRVSAGSLGLSWTILESGDGAVLQAVYAGKPDTDFAIQGTVEGQREILVAQPPKASEPARPRLTRTDQLVSYSPFLFIPFFLHPDYLRGFCGTFSRTSV